MREEHRGERVWWVCIPVDEVDVWTICSTPAERAEADCERIRDDIVRHIDVPIGFTMKLRREIEIRPPEEEPCES